MANGVPGPSAGDPESDPLARTIVPLTASGQYTQATAGPEHGPRPPRPDRAGQAR
jgi:hypothetical protein